jgi:hypothetical protein
MSRRLVGEATGIGKTAVGEYVRRAAVAGLGWPIPDEIGDAELERRLFPPPDAASSTSRTEPDWSYNHAELKRRGVTLALLWQEYRKGSRIAGLCEPICSRFERSDLARTPAVMGRMLAADRSDNTVSKRYRRMPVLRRAPHGRLRTPRGRCGSLLLYREGLAPSTPCRSPGALRNPSQDRTLGREVRLDRTRGLAACSRLPPL